MSRSSDGLWVACCSVARWCVPEIVLDGVNGFLVPPSDPNALAEALQCALATKWTRGDPRFRLPIRLDVNARALLVVLRRLRATEAANRRHPAQQSCHLEVSCGRVGAKITHANKPEDKLLALAQSYRRWPSRSLNVGSHRG